MKDQSNIGRVAILHPKFIPEIQRFIDVIESATGKVFLMVQGLRTFAQQDILYAQGRTTPGKIVTHAPGGKSWHNYGLAGDFCPFKDGSLTDLDWDYDFSTIRQIAIDNGLECGMDWPEPLTDRDHFENRFGLTIEQALAKYGAKDFIPNTQFINIP